MTKPGKCDSCRQRKVKCDELRPTCAVCHKGGRACSYTYGKAARFVTCHQTPRNRRSGPAGASSGASSISGESSSDSPSPPPGSGVLPGSAVLAGPAVLPGSAGLAPGFGRDRRRRRQPYELSPPLPATARQQQPQQGQQQQQGQQGQQQQPPGPQESSKSVVLSLRSTREAKLGNGLFQTFVPKSSERRVRLAAANNSTSRAGGPRSRSDSSQEWKLRPRSPWPLAGTEDPPAWSSDMATTNPSSSPHPPPRLSIFNPDPLHSKTRLLARWKDLIGCGGGGSGGGGGPDEASRYPIHAFGDWVELVASHIVESSAVEAATVSLVNSTNAYLNQEIQSVGSLPNRSYYVEEVSKSNEIALRAVRMALYERNPKSPPRLDILLAVKLLSTVELFMGAKTNFYRRHALGMINMLVNMYPQGGARDQVSLHMFYASCFTDATMALLSGRDSIFDNASWLGTPPPADSSSSSSSSSSATWRGTAAALQYNMQTFVRIPRLVRLVRRARAQPQDAAARAEAHALAAELFDTDLQWWVRDMVQMGALTAEPAALQRPGPESCAGEWLAFSSMRLFSLATTYWTARVLVCGCVQALCELEPLPLPLPPPHRLDQAAARAEDVRAAMSIAMCAQYAARTGPMMPVVLMRLQMPVIISFGAWHRLEMRGLMLSITGYDTPATDSERAHARSMKEWCVATSRDIGTKWNAALTDMADMEEKTDGFAGGPLCFSRKRA